MPLALLEAAGWARRPGSSEPWLLGEPRDQWLVEGPVGRQPGQGSPVVGVSARGCSSAQGRATLSCQSQRSPVWPFPAPAASAGVLWSHHPQGALFSLA